MKRKEVFKLNHRSKLNSSLIFFFLFTATTLSAQTPVDFSGKWAFDKSKSNPGEGGAFMEGNEILEITQSSSSITFSRTWIRKGREDVKTTEKYSFDGKEKIIKEDFVTTKKTAKWSDDKKTFTITVIMTTVSGGVSKDYLLADTYKLSDNDQTLTIESFSRNASTGERIINMVYNKK
jgi:hypothetical protein